MYSLFIYNRFNEDHYLIVSDNPNDEIIGYYIHATIGEIPYHKNVSYKIMDKLLFLSGQSILPEKKYQVLIPLNDNICNILKGI